MNGACTGMMNLRTTQWCSTALRNAGSEATLSLRRKATSDGPIEKETPCQLKRTLHSVEEFSWLAMRTSQKKKAGCTDRLLLLYCQHGALLPRSGCGRLALCSPNQDESVPIKESVRHLTALRDTHTHVRMHAPVRISFIRARPSVRSAARACVRTRRHAFSCKHEHAHARRGRRGGSHLTDLAARAEG